jgi:hypothetical protein
MRGVMLIYQPHVSRPEVRHFSHAPNLDDLREAIGGGWIEKVPGFHSIEHEGEVHLCVALADEEGKCEYRTAPGKTERKPDPTNNIATMLWDQALRRTGQLGLLMPNGQAADWLCGRIVVLFGDKQFMESL